MEKMNDIDVETLIADVAIHYRDCPEVFDAHASDAAAQLEGYGVDGPAMLLDYAGKEIGRPDELNVVMSDSDWFDACQVAMVAIMYFRGADALPALIEIAIGHAGGPESLAEDALFSLASEGVETIRIVNELADSLRRWYDPAMLDGFVQLGHVTPELIDVLKELIDQRLETNDEDSPEEFIALTGALSQLVPGEVCPYVPILREWVLKGVSYGPGDMDYTESDVPIMEWRGICSALVLHRLNPREASIREALLYWSTSHVNEEIRAMIRGALNGQPQGDPQAKSTRNWRSDWYRGTL